MFGGIFTAILITATPVPAASNDHILNGLAPKQAQSKIDQLVDAKDYPGLCKIFEGDPKRYLAAKLDAAKKVRGITDRTLVQCLVGALRRQLGPIPGSSEFATVQTQLQEAIVADLAIVVGKKWEIEFWKSHPRLKQVKHPQKNEKKLIAIAAEVDRWLKENPE